jgi:hypothetical protein
VSLVTIVKITEETELEKASTPSLDAPSQRNLKNEHEVESALDVESLDTLGIPMDNSRNELGLGEQGEEIT